MAPVAKELSSVAGILEPLQTKNSVDGQIEELHSHLKFYCRLPITLIGHSWGAWLSYLVAAWYPEIIRKLILVSCSPFEDRYADSIMDVRRRRLRSGERERIGFLAIALSDPSVRNKNTLFEEFGALLSKADTFDQVAEQAALNIKYSADIFSRIWSEVETMRTSGKLLEFASNIRCPVLAIHGDYDPHPAAGVEQPLSRTIKDFRFIVLRHCGHRPWMERKAREDFYKILKEEVVLV